MAGAAAPVAAPALASNLGNPAGPGASRAGQQLDATSNSPTGSIVGGQNPRPGGIAAEQAQTRDANLAAGEAFAAKALGLGPTPSFMTPAVQAYINQFQQSQEAQQQAMNAGLGSALSGLAARRDAAAATAAQLPAQYEQAYRQLTGADTRSAAAAGNAFQGSGSAKPAQQANAAGNQTMNDIGALQPLLKAGITADYTQGQTALENTNMQNQAAVADQQRQFDQQLALAQIQFQEQQSAQQAGYGHDIAMAELQSSLGSQGLANQLAVEKQYGVLPTQSTPQQQLQLSEQQNLDTQAQQAGFTNYAQLQDTIASPAYKAAVSLVNGSSGIDATALGLPAGTSLAKGSGGLQKTIQQLQQYNPNLLKALVYNHVITLPGLTATGTVSAPQVLG